MTPALELAARELRSLFAAPLAWILLAIVQAVSGLFFFVVFLWDFMAKQPMLVAAQSSFGITAYVAGPLFKSAALLLLLVTPLLTMRAVAEERRSGTLALLMSSPITMTGIVLGKYLGLLAFLGLLTGGILLMPLSLALGGSIDVGLLAAGGLGVFLSAASFAAAGLFVSSLSGHPATAAVGTFGLLIALWALEWAGRSGEGPAASVLSYLALTRHADPLMRGVFASADVAYFVLFILTFLVLAVRQLDALRVSR